MIYNQRLAKSNWILGAVGCIQKAYLERIRFAEEERLMRIYDDEGLEVIRGNQMNRLQTPMSVLIELNWQVTWATRTGRGKRTPATRRTGRATPHCASNGCTRADYHSVSTRWTTSLAVIASSGRVYHLICTRPTAMTWRVSRGTVPALSSAATTTTQVIHHFSIGWINGCLASFATVIVDLRSVEVDSESRFHSWWGNGMHAEECLFPLNMSKYSYRIQLMETRWNNTNIEPFTAWPLNKAEVTMTPFVTGSEIRGNNGWGSVLRRFFFSSKATAITVDENVPLWVSVNANQSQRLCIQARGNEFPYRSPEPDLSADVKDAGSDPIYSVLNYTICMANDLLTLKTSLADTTMWDGLKKNEMDVIRELMEDPVWRFQPKANDYNATNSLMKFTNDIVGVVWTSPGYLVIDAPWEEHPGDLEFDSRRFQVSTCPFHYNWWWWQHQELFGKQYHSAILRILGFFLFPFVGRPNLTFLKIWISPI